MLLTVSLRNIVRVIISRKMRSAGYAAHMEEMRNPYNTLFGKREGKRTLRIILE